MSDGDSLTVQPDNLVFGSKSEPWPSEGIRITNVACEPVSVRVCMLACVCVYVCVCVCVRVVL